MGDSRGSLENLCRLKDSSIKSPTSFDQVSKRMKHKALATSTITHLLLKLVYSLTDTVASL